MHSKHNKYLDLDVLVESGLSKPQVLSSKSTMIFEELVDVIECIKEIYPEKYPKFYIAVSRLINDDYITEEIYEYAVSKMKNTDGTFGAKIQSDVILSEAKKIGLVPTAMTSNEDILYITNMYASDNWDKTISNEENIAFAVKAAKGFLVDLDAPQVPGRALRFFSKVVMWEPNKTK